MSGVRRPARILVVDDNPDDLYLLQLAFCRAGSTCILTPVLGGEAAVRILDSCDTGGMRPDLVLVDWKMPVVSGGDVLRAIRGRASLCGLPVLVFSSSDDPIDVRAAYAAGATCYLTKPPGLYEYHTLVRDIEAFWCRPVLYDP